jgi:hypothetical protein
MNELKMWNIHTTEYHSTLQRKQILTQATIWKSLEDMMLSEISKTQKDKYCMILLIYGKYTHRAQSGMG